MNPESSDSAEPLALLWDAILSRQPRRIQSMYQALDPAARKAICAHLRKMATEDGWHPEQRQSAQIALDTIRELGE